MRGNTLKFIEDYIRTLINQKEPIGQSRLVASINSYSTSEINLGTATKYGYRIKAILAEKGLISESPTYKKSAKKIIFNNPNRIKNIRDLALEVYDDFIAISRDRRIPKDINKNIDLPEKVEWFILIRDNKMTLMRNDTKIAIIPIGKKDIGVNLSKEAVIAFKQPK